MRKALIRQRKSDGRNHIKGSFWEEVETLSEAEKKIIDILAEKAARVGEQEQQLVLAYAAGLADGARSVQTGEKAG